ncbi:MAG: hypothetical protein HY267_03875 [Deltaproteobacteria bacterium]|nr:hypothetical protein [Deltaproteobacteria bacterium]
MNVDAHSPLLSVFGPYTENALIVKAGSATSSALHFRTMPSKGTLIFGGQENHIPFSRFFIYVNAREEKGKKHE